MDNNQPPTDSTYVGPRHPDLDRMPELSPEAKAPVHGLVYAAIAFAVLALIVGFSGIWIGSVADSKAETVDGRVTTLNKAHDALAKKVTDEHDWTVAQLALKATATDVETAIETLNTKADQSVVEKLTAEMADKANSADFKKLAGDLLLKADKKVVARLVRRVNSIDGRLKILESPNVPVTPTPPAAQPKTVSLVVAPALIPPTPPPGKAIILPGKASTPGALYNPGSPMQSGPDHLVTPPKR